MSEDSTAASGGDLGYFTRDQMVREFADAAWSLNAGQISDPVRSPFGFHGIRLTDVQPARELALEEARPQVLASLKETRARAEVQRRASEFASAVKSAGGDFPKAAREAGVVPKEFSAFHAGETLGDLGPQPAVAPALFALKPGEISTPLPVTAGLVVLQYREATAGAPLPLEKVLDRVSADSSRALRLEAAARMLAAAGGTPDLAATAKKLKVERKQTGAVPRTGPAADLGSDPGVLEKLFALNAGEASAPLALPSGSVAVAKMVERSDPMQGFEAQQAALRNTLLLAKKDRIFRAYLERLRSVHPAEINTALIEQVDRI